METQNALPILRFYFNVSNPLGWDGDHNPEDPAQLPDGFLIH